MEDEYDAKHVYANFGLAMYAAQCLEHELVNAMFIMSLMPDRDTYDSGDKWEHQVDSFYSKHFEHTLGRLIHDLGKQTTVPKNLSDELAKALSLRNWLAHDYFRERAAVFMTKDGKESMILELQNAVEVLRRADALVGNITEPLKQKYGITEEKIDFLIEKLIEEARK